MARTFGVALLALALMTVALPASAQPASDHAADQAAAPQPTPDGTGAYAAGELLLRFDPATPEQVRADARQRHNLEKLEDLPLPGLERVRMRGQGSPPERAAQTGGDPAVRDAEPNFLLAPSGHAEVIPEDPDFSKLWGLRNTGQSGGTPGADIAASRAWTVADGARDVVVGVIDTGTMVDHPTWVRRPG